jgi:Fic family protein
MGSFEERIWTSDGWGMNRRERAGGSYRPYIPNVLSGKDIWLSPEASESVSVAESAIRDLSSSHEHAHGTDALARLILRSEAMASSKIEGLEVNATKLLESEALEELGVPHYLDGTEAQVMANITTMENGVGRLAEAPLTFESMHEVNAGLLKSSPVESYGGKFREVQNWVGGNGSNPIGADYVPPVPERVVPLMEDLVSFVNSSNLPTLAVAALAHAQFETIHPYVDGNGRTGRTLIHGIMQRGGLVTAGVVPISLVLATDRQRYVTQLTAYRLIADPDSDAQRLAWSDWIEYFSRSCLIACRRAGDFFDSQESLRDEWYKRIRPRSGSATALLIDKLVDNPVVSISSAARLTGRSHEAARNAVHRLEDEGVLKQNSRNRKSGLFVATEVLQAFTAYERSLATVTGDTGFEKPRRPVPQRNY